MTLADAQLIFEAVLQSVVTCYMIGFAMGIVIKVIWQALAR